MTHALADAVTQMVNRARLEGHSAGVYAATALPEASYGATHASVVVLTGTSMLELRRQVRDRRWRRYGDNPGQAYAGSCDVVAVWRGDQDALGWVYLIRRARHFGEQTNA